ncbi:NAD(P)/FAD-dependent oxidoreductase [Pollutimonas harenae]|uniref:FAD-binding oxidoreductase n=1 Tax=Pollutimonas harenae TaxID=657015 RepID=A0A853H1J4_9BURK|nr:FAD-binding oxidoreductase [Pollutimonas harenae]NYT85105.1 FAD-binding oxidoreductase [Pollutimonas harenae]TEA72513.1 FAD-binding oxidoreductase [Pollutimonas harenae]
MTDQAHTPHALIVGAGIVGLYTAFHLRRAGWRVQIMDRGEPGMGCSAGNAGALSSASVAPLGMPGIVRQAPRMLLDPSGPLSVPPYYWLTAAPWLLRFIQASRPENVAAISQALRHLLDQAISCHLQAMHQLGEDRLVHITGQLHLYPNDKAAAKDSSGWALRRQHGIQVEKLNYPQIQSLEPHIGPHYQLGYFMPDQGMVVNPLRQAQALATALASQGVEFLRDEALSLQREEQRITGVVGRQGMHKADHIVVCAGAWSAKLLQALGYKIPLETQRGYHLTLSDSGIALNRPVVAADRKIFVTPMETGLRLAGTVEFGGLNRGPTQRRLKPLLQYGKLLLPELNTSAKAQSWMGHRPCLPDSLPVLGPAQALGGLWLNFGHGHLGLTMSAVSGKLLSQAMQGRTPDIALAPYALERFSTRP